MRRGPKPKYCYVCRSDGPCSGDALCNRLSKEKKAEAYRLGYYAKHGKKLLKKAKERYRVLTAPAALEREQERKRLLDEIEDKQRLIRDEDYKRKIAVLNVRLERLRQRAAKIELRSQTPKQHRSKPDPDPEAEKVRIRNRDRIAGNRRRVASGLKPRRSLEECRAQSARLCEEKGDKRTRWRNILRARLLPKVIARLWLKVEKSADAKREVFRKQMYAQWESVDDSKTIGQIRSDRHKIRMEQAAAYYEQCKAFLDTYDGPGAVVGGARYINREQADAARKAYSKAYAIVYQRTPRGRARERDQDAMRRFNPRPQSGAPEFYRNMYLSPDAECFYCHRQLMSHERCGDHYIPRARGGPHCNENLRIACYPCNSAKSDRMPEEFQSTVVRVNPVVSVTGMQELLF